MPESKSAQRSQESQEVEAEKLIEILRLIVQEYRDHSSSPEAAECCLLLSGILDFEDTNTTRVFMVYDFLFKEKNKEDSQGKPVTYIEWLREQDQSKSASKFFEGAARAVGIGLIILIFSPLLIIFFPVVIGILADESIKDYPGLTIPDLFKTNVFQFEKQVKGYGAGHGFFEKEQQNKVSKEEQPEEGIQNTTASPPDSSNHNP